MRRGIIAAAAVAYAVMLAVQSEAGQKPDPRFSAVDPNIVVCPAGDSLFRIISRDNLGYATVNNTVIVDFCGCPGVVFGPSQPADAYILDGCRTIGVTSMYGVIDFHWRAGGVCNGPVAFHLDGIAFPARAYVASTDQNGDLVVTQADVDAATAKVGGTDLTADLDGDLAVTANDVAILQAHLGHNVDGTVDVPPSTPGALRLYAAIPNPARAETVIPFDLPRRGAVTMEAFDASGRRVRELLGAWMLPAGNHRVTWDGRDFAGARVSPGVYFIRVRAGGEQRFGRIARVQ